MSLSCKSKEFIDLNEPTVRLVTGNRIYKYTIIVIQLYLLKCSFKTIIWNMKFGYFKRWQSYGYYI